MAKKLLLNQIMTPDGTLLRSTHRHDYREHTDTVTGELYFVDGGLDYQRVAGDMSKAKDLTVYEGDPFDQIRLKFHWGTRGKDGNSNLQWVPLAQMELEHIFNILGQGYLTQENQPMYNWMLKEVSHRINKHFT